MVPGMLSREAARRGAINLNNCGVILLSRRLWCDALDTFKDAMRLMKSTTNEQGESERDAQLALHRAWQRTAIEFHPATQARQGPILRIVSSQCDPDTVESLSSHEGAQDDTKFVAMIDPIDFEEWDTDATDLEAACILYNFGIAHSLLSFVSGCDYASKMLRDNSYRILELTQPLAFQLFSKALNKTHLCIPIMLINMLIAVNLMHMSSQNNPVASEVYCGHLKDLLCLTRAHQKLLLVADNTFASAA